MIVRNNSDSGGSRLVKGSDSVVSAGESAGHLKGTDRQRERGRERRRVRLKAREGGWSKRASELARESESNERGGVKERPCLCVFARACVCACVCVCRYADPRTLTQSGAEPHGALQEFRPTTMPGVPKVERHGSCALMP